MRIAKRVLLIVSVVGLLIAAPWAFRPFLYPPQGLHPTGWTYSQLIRERYPRHLIDPAWLSDDIHWTLAETGARIGVLALSAACVFAWCRFTRQAQPD
jgi:hypothetical protein